MSEYVAGAGTTGMSIAGLATGVLGTLGAAHNGFGIFGGNNQYVTKESLNMAMTIAQKDSEIALLKSEQNTEVKIADVYERVMARVNANKAEQDAINRDQAVYNGVNNSVVGVLRSQVDQLMGLTALHIPSDNVCPTPMPKFNSWTAPTT